MHHTWPSRLYTCGSHSTTAAVLRALSFVYVRGLLCTRFVSCHRHTMRCKKSHGLFFSTAAAQPRSVILRLNTIKSGRFSFKKQPLSPAATTPVYLAQHSTAASKTLNRQPCFKLLPFVPATRATAVVTVYAWFVPVVAVCVVGAQVRDRTTTTFSRPLQRSNTHRRTSCQAYEAYSTGPPTRNRNTDPDWGCYLVEGAFYANSSIIAHGFIIFL